MTIEEIVRDIRKQCRLAMDGITSTSMREKGIIYKLNFGVPISKITRIAGKYTPSKELAEVLWDEDVRELKILATMLFPIDQFSKETADKWVRDIKYQEIREQVSINILQHLKCAELLTREWTSYDSEDIRSTGYWLLSVLSKTKKLTSIDLDLYPSIWEDSSNENNTVLRSSAITALKFVGRISPKLASEVMYNTECLKDSPNPIHVETYNTLKFEFEYFFE